MLKNYYKNYYKLNRKKIIEQQNELRKNSPWKKIFSGIKYRCNNPKSTGYKYYGGRGIKCDISESEIRELWIRDSAWNMTKPSIDRKDKDKNYEYNNCRFIEMKINAGKDKEKIVLQFDKNYNFIKKWNSINQASKNLNIPRRSMSNSLNNWTKTAGGFIWQLLHNM